MYDVVIIGGGIVGLATASALMRRTPGLRLLVLEKEAQVASHQTGHNSGVIHSGVYYRPGSLKARLCVDGAKRMRDFCQAHGLPCRRVGKLIVAVDARELATLAMLEERGRANGVPGVTRIGPERLRELEPAVQGLAALHLPEVSIVDYAAIAQAMARDVTAAGGTIRTGTRVRALQHAADGWHLETTAGEVHASRLINCGGLHADRLGVLSGDRPGVQIVPFRGEYYTLASERSSLVQGLVYPVPDPALPFLGVHFTKMLDSGVHVGPNAVLALAREGYRRRDVSLRDTLELARFRGFWRMAKAWWRFGLEEQWRSWSRAAFVRAAQRLVPSVQVSDLRPCAAGVRAQAVAEDGRLVDDFVLHAALGALHIYNAPSPAATASLAIGETIAQQLDSQELPSHATISN
jgi:L-2-hydroxyglutarate oxidase LhgO